MDPPWSTWQGEISHPTMRIATGGGDPSGPARFFFTLLCATVQ